MDALELALHCSSLLMRTMTKEIRDVNSESPNVSQNSASFVSSLRQQLDDSDCERHFKLCGQFMTVVVLNRVNLFGRCLGRIMTFVVPATVLQKVVDFEINLGS